MCATCFGLYLGHPQGCQYNNTKGVNFFFICYLPLYGFCVDMPEDGLKTGQNM